MFFNIYDFFNDSNFPILERMDLWFQFLLYFISLITLFIEIYVIWLIVYKTTQKMASFRYHLMSLMVIIMF
jgi:hypothetical protein